MSEYREKIVSDTPAPPAQAIKVSDAHVSNVEVEPPFTSYETDKGKPFLVDHYELGSLWNETDMYSQGYKPEVESINTYLNYLIDKGELNNSLPAVREKLKSIEKMVNVGKEERTAVRVGKVAAYVDFLIKTDNIKKDAAKYGAR